MKNKSIVALIATTALTVLFSCTKVEIAKNPEELVFSSAPFTVQVDERRCYKDFTYNIPEDDAPVLTYWNTVTITASSDDPSFNGVNVASSDPAVMSVERTDKPGVYSVIYHSDGQAEIRVWNSAYEQTFIMPAQHTIELEGIRFKVYSEHYSTEFVAKADSKLPSPYWADNYLYDMNNFTKKDEWFYFNEYDFGCQENHDKFTIEIVDLVPENTSWRMIARVFGASPYYGDYSEWITDGVTIKLMDIKDASEITGKKVIATVDSPKEGKISWHKFFVASFKTNCKDYKTPIDQIKYTTVVCYYRTLFNGTM